MKHLDLFSGIGGFALATEMVWEDVEHTFVEYDPFCQAVLKKHWPEAKIHGDIREFVADSKSERQLSKNEHENNSEESRERGRREFARKDEIFILTGGFPCQPFSQAGRRKGTADDRYLWPPMLECIALYRPRWVIAENVAGLITWNDGMVLETVCIDLEKEGYEVQPFVIPAVAVGAPHRRDRVWIVAHAEGAGNEREVGDIRGEECRQGSALLQRTHATDSNASNTSDERLERNGERWKNSEGRNRLLSGARGAERTDWNENWLEVATRLCRVDDGVSADVDRIRLIEYIKENGIKAEGETTETSAKSDTADTMRILRLYIKIAEASLQGVKTVDESENPMPEMSHKRGHEKRQVGGWKKEEEKMRYLQSLVSSKESCQEGKDMLSKMPLDIREAQRIVAVASQRNPRLKALGNAIVRQVAAEIMKAIKATRLTMKDS